MRVRAKRHEWPELERLGMYLESACSHFRQIKHLIHEMSQMVCRRFDSFNRPDLT